MAENEHNKELQIRKLDTLLKISNMMNENEQPSALMKKISQVIAEFLEADRVSFFFHDKIEDKLYTHFAWGLEKGEVIVEKDIGIVGLVYSSNVIVRTNSPYEHPNFHPDIDIKTGYKTKSLIALPIVHKKNIIGAFQALNKNGDLKFTENDEDFLVEVLAQSSGLLNLLKQRDFSEYQAHMLRNAVGGILKWADEFRRSHKIGT